MRKQSIFKVTLFFLIAMPAFSQNTCRISDLTLDDVHSCTNTHYTYEFSFTATDPVSSEYKVYIKELPNGKWTYLGTQTYQKTSFGINARKRFDYALYIFDAIDASCSLRDTIPPQNCMAPCWVDSLSITTVQCHPGSNSIEVRFDYPTNQFKGGFLYEVFEDTVQFNLLWMAPWGRITIPDRFIGDTVTICQVDDSLCCRDFVIPACDTEVCPIAWAQSAVPDTCINGQVRYSIFVEHAPPLESSHTEIEILDENGRFVQFFPLMKNETEFILVLPESPTDRMYTLCDAYRVCCVPLLIPGADCDSLLASSWRPSVGPLSIFPNPAVDQLTIEWPEDLPGGPNVEFIIRDIAGRALQTGSLEPSRTDLDISGLMPGHYIVELKIAGRTGYVGRFVRLAR